MSERKRPRRSLWMFGLESEEPSYEQRAAAAARLSNELGVELTAPRIPPADALELRAPRISPPDQLAAFCFTSTWERAYHSYGSDRSLPGVRGHYPNPPDVVAHPRTEAELEAVLDWCSRTWLRRDPLRRRLVRGRRRHPAGGRGDRSSRSRWTSWTRCSRSTTSPGRPASRPGCSARTWRTSSGRTVTRCGTSRRASPGLDPRRLDRDPVGRPLRDQPHPHRRVRRVGADDHAERLVGVAAAARRRRRPGPEPARHRQSEGILGIITEAWMRIQARPRLPRHRRRPRSPPGRPATRRPAHRPGQAVAGQPAAARPAELAAASAGLDGTQAAAHRRLRVGRAAAAGAASEQAVGIARDCGGIIPDDELVVDDGTGQPTGRSGAAGAWRRRVHPPPAWG